MLFSHLPVPEQPCDAPPPASFIPSRMIYHRFLYLRQRKTLSRNVCLRSALPHRFGKADAHPNDPGQPNDISMLHLVNGSFCPRPWADAEKSQRVLVKYIEISQHYEF